MPTNEAEKYLEEIATRSFPGLWTVSNPFKEPGKELADLFVPFGRDLVVISDKASQFGNSMPLSWERWRRRTIDASLKQLNGAVRSIKRSSNIYLDNRASADLPFSLPAVADQQLHLIAITRPAHNPHEKRDNWEALTFDSDAVLEPFKVGPTFVGDHFVHVFDGETIEFLLTQLDTAPDFIQYLKGREQALRDNSHIVFAERDLFATAARSWTQGDGFTPKLPRPDTSGRITLPADLWTTYEASSGATLTKAHYANSKNIDLLVDHFHSEYAKGRNLSFPQPTYDSHENAMRILAGESRFSRRIIADALMNLLEEENNKTFWAATIPSPDFANVRYVWLTYPEPPRDVTLENCEQFILHRLRQHLFVARTTFGAVTFVGIAVPNKGIKTSSYFMCVMDGTNWSQDDEQEAQRWKSQGIFSDLKSLQHFYKP